MNERSIAGSDRSSASRRRWTIAGTVTIATSMELLDISIVNVAIPTIAGDLGITQDESTWILTAYPIANAIVIPMSEQSILADTFPGQRTSLAFAVYGTGIVLAPTLGPTWVVHLTDNFGWRWICFINIPAGNISLLLSHRNVVDPAYLKTREAGKKTIDYVGLAFLVAHWGRCRWCSIAGSGWINSSPR